MKNFTEASVACLSRLRYATRANVLRLDVSKARNSTNRSVAAAVNIMPTTARSMSA